MTFFEEQSNHTLYVQNLDDKIKKKELKQSLYCLFSQYGLVLEIVALKTIKMRGQAFIVFDQVIQAAAAMKALQGFSFYDRGLVRRHVQLDSHSAQKISYAKTKSKSILIKEGKYFPLLNKREDNPLKRAGSDIEYESGDEEQLPAAKVPRTNAQEEPESTLFLSNLPSDITTQQLEGLFQQYPGFKEIRSVPGKSDIAFVEYENPTQAKAAKSALDGFKLSPTTLMTIDYSKQ